MSRSNAKKTAAPPIVTPVQLMQSLTVSGFNTAAVHDAQRQDVPPAEIAYTIDVDQGLASRRSKYFARSHAQVAAATHGVPAAGLGLSFRMAMPGQGENDIFPMTTDRYGKQRR